MFLDRSQEGSLFFMTQRVNIIPLAENQTTYTVRVQRQMLEWVDISVMKSNAALS